MSDRAKCIALTGVSRGLGEALTEVLLARGHTVLGCARNAAATDSWNVRCGSPWFTQVDVADDQQVAAWAQQVLAQHGPPDLLVNNAALINVSAPLWEVPAEEFSDVVDGNIKGTANVIRHFLPAMIERGSGVVVNFSSGWGRSTSPEVAPYCATKWAIEGLTRAPAQELPAGLGAVALNPGIINTQMLQSCFGAASSAYPPASEWATGAADRLLKLEPTDNGRSITVE